MTIDTFDVTTPEGETHPFFEADVTIYNPAPVTIDPIGTISMKIKLANTGTIIGYVRAKDVSLVPGPNKAHISGPMIPDSITEANAAMSDYFLGNPVPLIGEIDDIVYDNGAVSWPATDNLLFEGGMKGTEVGANLQRDHVNFAAYGYVGRASEASEAVRPPAPVDLRTSLASERGRLNTRRGNHTAYSK